MGLDDVADTAASESRERAASLELLLGIVEDLVASLPGIRGAAADAGIDDVLAELDRRDAAEAATSTGGVNLLTYHRSKGLEWDAVYLPGLDEGMLPIRQAKEAEQVAEERRLLYVGITRARRFLAISSSSRKPSRFLAELEPNRPKRAASTMAPGGRTGRVRLLPGAPIATASVPDEGLLDALRVWRRERAQEDSVPAYVVAHDTTLAEIADARPRTLPALRRIRGMGPIKLEKYGPEILAVVERDA
jgi:DNA helicase-2/ATP-dependent DNA helicase PcrA